MFFQRQGSKKTQSEFQELLAVAKRLQKQYTRSDDFASNFNDLYGKVLEIKSTKSKPKITSPETEQELQPISPSPLPPKEKDVAVEEEVEVGVPDLKDITNELQISILKLGCEFFIEQKNLDLQELLNTTNDVVEIVSHMANQPGNSMATHEAAQRLPKSVREKLEKIEITAVKMSRHFSTKNHVGTYIFFAGATLALGLIAAAAVTSFCFAPPAGIVLGLMAAGLGMALIAQAGAVMSRWPNNHNEVGHALTKLSSQARKNEAPEPASAQPAYQDDSSTAYFGGHNNVEAHSGLFVPPLPLLPPYPYGMYF